MEKIRIKKIPRLIEFILLIWGFGPSGEDGFKHILSEEFLNFLLAVFLLL